MANHPNHSVAKERLAELERYIEFSPKDPGPIAQGLRGWTDGGVSVCGHCAGRIIACGFGTAFRKYTAVFESNTFQGCSLRACDN